MSACVMSVLYTCVVWRDVFRVEFQSKFYEGEGTLFQPFTFKELLKIDSIEDLK